jgi:DNA-binding CsgD family transcriptional regulator
LGVETLPQPIKLSYLCPEIARLAALIGAPEQIARIATVQERLAARHPAANLRAVAALCRGVASQDTEALLGAAEAYRRAGRSLYEGYAYELAAGVLATERRAAAAHAALDTALERYDLLDASWDIDRAAKVLRQAGFRRRRVRQRPRTGFDSLTDTERKIAGLVADGHSSPDIAAELFLSRRTVQSHVSRILAKLGLNSRIELVVAMRDGTDDSTSPNSGVGSP